MDSLFNDILFNKPILVVIITIIVSLVAESVRSTRAMLLYYISLAGTSLAFILSIIDFNINGSCFNGMLLYGGFANYFAALYSAIVFAITLISKNYFVNVSYHRGEYYLLLNFALLGMMLISSANDLIILFIGIELLSICLYVLVGLIRTDELANEASLKYFLMGAFATGFLLYGISFIYGSVGSVNLMVIWNFLSTPLNNKIFILGVGLVLVGIAFKSAIVPFHMWVPDVYQGASTPVTALMSTAVKAAGFSAFILIFIKTINILDANIYTLLAILSALSMIVGNVTAIAQTNIKRMLAYSSIAHAGYMLAGIVSADSLGQVAVMYYIVTYSIVNIAVFAIAILLEIKLDKGLLIESYAGLSKSNPIVALIMAICMFSLIGIPPFAGFFSKYFVFVAAINSQFTWLAIVGVLTSVISSYYYLRIVVLMYFKESSMEINVTKNIFVLLIICAVLLIILGLFPSLLIQIAEMCL